MFGDLFIINTETGAGKNVQRKKKNLPAHAVWLGRLP